MVEQVLSGEVVSGVVVSDALIVAYGGISVSSVISGYGQIGVYSGGEAINTFIYGSEAFESVASGGLTISAQVAGSGQEELLSGAVSSDAQIIGGTAARSSPSRR